MTGWQELQLRRLFSKQIAGSWGSDPEDGEMSVACVRGTDFNYTKLRVAFERCPQRGLSRSDFEKRRLRRGDLVLEKSGGGDTQPVGRAVLFDGDLQAVPTNFASLLRPRAGVDSRFAVYLLASLWETGATRATINQTTGIQNLDSDLFFSIRVRVPERTVQCAIADYLDAETDRIDALIEKKRRMIELLEERFNTLVSMAVAQGIPKTSSDTSMLSHPSLEWLGAIPRHWTLGRFSRQVRIAEGQVDPRVEPYASMLLIAPNHIESRTGRLLEMETATEQAAESGKYICQEGDVIYSKIRPALAKVVMAPTQCLCSADMYPLTPGPQIRSTYLRWLLLSKQFTAWSVLESERVAMPKINRETLVEIYLPVPPLREQDEIADYLETRFGAVQAARTALDDSVRRLQERRQALITAAVTGQIPIPGVAA